MTIKKDEIALLDDFAKAHLANGGDPSIAYAAALSVLEQRRELLAAPTPTPAPAPTYPDPTDWLDVGDGAPVYAYVEVDYGDQTTVDWAHDINWTIVKKYRILEKPE